MDRRNAKMTTYYILQAEQTLIKDSTIPAQFKTWLEGWIKSKEGNVLLYTDRTFQEVSQVLGIKLISSFAGVFTQGGRVFVNSKGRVLFEAKTKPLDQKLLDWAASHAGQTTKLELRGSQFIRVNAGSLFISPVGYDLDVESSKKYQAWDKKAKERAKLIFELQKQFPSVQAKIDQTVGIEVTQEQPIQTPIEWLHFLQRNDKLVIYCNNEIAQQFRDQLQSVSYQWEIDVSTDPSSTFQTMKHYNR